MCMKRLIYPLIFLTLGSCYIFDFESQSYTIDQLDELYQEIISLAESKECSNAEDWDFVALGSKPCGGPWEYIAYSKKINVEDFLDKVAHYNELQREDNIRNNRFSNCMYVGPPSDVVCEAGKAVLVYD